jgi:hypothetical protein
MTIEAPIPGGVDLHLHYLLLDVNGTLTDRGDLVDDVQTASGGCSHDLRSAFSVPIRSGPSTPSPLSSATSP